jgi:tRNA-specific 2-thiouridylase
MQPNFLYHVAEKVQASVFTDGGFCIMLVVMNKTKVFVGLSGGVDSSVSAAILKKEGYDVTGVFIKVWQPPFLECTWKEDRLDAMRVSAHLDIPFMTLDLEKEYKESIVDYMIAEYKAGRTPNPDVMCNKTIKFGAFLNKAKELGADFVATGHYARKRAVESNEYKKVESTTDDGRTVRQYELLTGKDQNKDQSYFLWTLTQDQLKHILFPIGEFEKSHVRELAKEFDLITATKKDSQGLCFLGKLNMKDFLKEFIAEKRGDVLNEDGFVIGYHENAMYYTLGQRHGFMITKKTPTDDPYYVIAKDIKNNTITVGHKKDGEIGREKGQIRLTGENWISRIPEDKEKLSVRIRYRQAPQGCTVSYVGDDVYIIFDDPQVVDAGQSAVLYDKEICLGGGVVSE